MTDQTATQSLGGLRRRHGIGDLRATPTAQSSSSAARPNEAESSASSHPAAASTQAQHTSGYRDDFFVPGNIIGYTGSIGNNPTVYFKNNDEFGRITQDHKNKNNIGRNKIIQDPNYQIRNDGPHGNAVEYYDRGDGQHRARHYSRNQFVPIENASPEDKTALAQAIGKFPNIKPKYQG